MSTKRKRRPRLLSTSRPSNFKSVPSLSSRTTRATVRTYHTLRKQLSSAQTKGDVVGAEKLQAQIEDQGGILKYQQASILGQSAERGGDTSKLLIEWLSDVAEKHGRDKKRTEKLRLLEIGALRTDNVCSRSGLFNVERIDLHSQHPNIKEQDFMKRPMPRAADLDQEGYDIVSLSLVVNFIGDPAERGDMLRRVEAFLRPPVDEQLKLHPALFLVLPAPCVTNSRYLNENRLEILMRSLGYRKAKRKMSAKLVYYLWTHSKTIETKVKSFGKETVRTGKSRNNFAIVLR